MTFVSDGGKETVLSRPAFVSAIVQGAQGQKYIAMKSLSVQDFFLDASLSA